MTNFNTQLTYSESVEPIQFKSSNADKDTMEVHQHGGLLKPEHYLACILQNADASKLDFHKPEELADKFTSLAIACHLKMVQKLDALRKQKEEAHERSKPS